MIQALTLRTTHEYFNLMHRWRLCSKLIGTVWANFWKCRKLSTLLSDINWMNVVLERCIVIESRVRTLWLARWTHARGLLASWLVPRGQRTRPPIRCVSQSRASDRRVQSATFRHCRIWLIAVSFACTRSGQHYIDFLSIFRRNQTNWSGHGHRSEWCPSNRAGTAIAGHWNRWYGLQLP